MQAMVLASLIVLVSDGGLAREKTPPYPPLSPPEPGEIVTVIPAARPQYREKNTEAARRWDPPFPPNYKLQTR